MSNLSAVQSIYWHTTPGELREIADEMERVYPDLRVADNKIVETIDDGTTALKILVDQEEMGDPESYPPENENESRFVVTENHAINPDAIVSMRVVGYEDDLGARLRVVTGGDQFLIGGDEAERFASNLVEVVGHRRFLALLDGLRSV